ncbi:MAG TPA: DUF3106 domain-containing protein [Thiolapillus brandeum]|uniref:DUF3106 domain-containing protein n=1 Tax=Thiolapillus brandeum TaxID=1076588 RepID=A0A7C5IZQ0_9GAMM|nr:DUF3106 domain-containing protein [Thiolapillus brandeum]
MSKQLVTLVPFPEILLKDHFFTISSASGTRAACRKTPTEEIIMNRQLVPFTLLLSLAIPAVAGAADLSPPTAEEMAEIRNRMQSMSPEEQAQYRTEMQERMRNLSPEDREQYRSEMRQRMQSMSPEERAQYREANGMGNGRGQSGGNRYAYGQGNRDGSGNQYRYGQGRGYDSRMGGDSGNRYRYGYGRGYESRMGGGHRYGRGR